MNEGRREPLDSELEASYSSSRRMWSLALVTPILYLLLGMMCESMGWTANPEDRQEWDSPLILGGMSAGCALLFGLTIWRKFSLRRAMRRVPAGGRLAATLWRREALRMLMLADSQGFVGLVIFLISTRNEALLAGGVAAYLTYAVACPARSDLRPV